MSTPNYFQVKYNGINLNPTTASTATAGDIAYNTTSSKYQIFTTGTDFLVTEAGSATLTNKTIAAGTNTISGLTNANLSGSAAITNANLASMAANTVKANITGSPALPTDAALGTATETASSVLSLNGWTNATIGSPTITVVQATTSSSGYLSATDWNTFNNKQGAGSYITSLTGDVTASGPGAAAATLTAVTNNTITTLSSLTSVSTITTGTWNATTIAIAHGGTGQVTAPAAYNALSPMTTTGDMEYEASPGTAARLPVGTTNQVLATVGGIPAWTNISALPIPQGTKNYLTQYAASNGGGALNPGNGNWELGNTSGWSLANTTLSGVIPTGAAAAGTPFDATHGGSAASGNLSLTVVSSGQLSGSTSGSLASSAASVAGDMIISNGFYIDTEDQAKVQTIKAYYSAVSGSANLNFSGTSSNSYAVWIYDVTNAAWIMPAGVYNIVQGSGTGYITATFQTTSNSIRYQLALININASAGAFTLYLDDLSVGPQTAPMAPAMSDWVAYTPTLTGVGTATNVSFYWKREGKDLLVSGSYMTGTVAHVLYSISLPSVSIDTTVLPVPSNTTSNAGSNIGTYSGFGGGESGSITTAAGTNAALVYAGEGWQAVSGVNALTPTFADSIHSNSQQYGVEFRVPIAGWSSNSVASSDTDTRVVAAQIQGQISNSPTAGNPIIFPTVIKDTHAAYNNSTGQYTAPVSGFYSVSCAFSCNSIPIDTGIFAYVGGVQDQLVGLTSVATVFGGGSCVVYANAGQTIDVRANNNITGGSSNPGSLTFNRLSGPAVITATESVNCQYYASGASQTISNTQQFNFDTKVYDSHNAVTTGSGWKFTVPVSGVYNVSVFLGGNTSGGNAAFGLYKNGSTLQPLCFSTSDNPAQGSGDCKLNAGDTIDIRSNGSILFSTIGSLPGVSGGNCYITIHRVGN